MRLTQSNLALAVAIALIGVVGLFTVIALDRQGQGRLTIKSGDHELAIDFADNRLNFSEVLGSLLSDPYRRETLAILREGYNLYDADSELLVDRIRRTSPDTRLAGRLRELLFDLKGPFSRAHHYYYDITDQATVDAINALDYTHPVAAKLRALRDSARGIFESRGISVEVATPRDGALADGVAAVCEGSAWRGRDLVLLNRKDESRTVTVFARNAFECITVGDAEPAMPLILISFNDRNSLFGTRNAGEKEQAILYPSPKGYSIRPTLVALSGKAG